MYDLVLSPLEIADEIEVVERKGAGHPDTNCNALAEALGSLQNSLFAGNLSGDRRDRCYVASQPVRSLCFVWPKMQKPMQTQVFPTSASL